MDRAPRNGGADETRTGSRLNPPPAIAGGPRCASSGEACAWSL